MPYSDDGAIVIAHRIPASITPLGQWLKEVAGRVVLVTSRQAADAYAGTVAEVIPVADYSGTDEIVDHLHRICRTRQVARIVYGTEDDVLRLARVRDRYGIPGLSESDALPYRDKLLMKEVVSGVARTPEFLKPATSEDALAFASRVGLPVVVKPRLGYGSRGVVVARSTDALLAELAARPADDVMLEQFIPGDVYHVDGFMERGSLLFSCPSRYLNNCLAFADGIPLGSLQLDDGTPLAEELAAFAADVVKRLPGTEFTPFHLEVFRHADSGALYFCEIAARIGGAHVLETLTAATGRNPVKTWFRRQAGIKEPTDFVRVSDRFGWLLVPPRAGLLERVDGPPLPDFVEQFHVKADLPHRFDAAESSTDAVMSFVVRDGSSRQVETNLHACADWAYRAMKWGES